MDIHQVSINYLHEQDRILVRINTHAGEEIRLWLTRRLCTHWVPTLHTVLRQTNGRDAPWEDVPAPSQEVAQPWSVEFNELQALKTSDFKTPFKADAQSWPLGSEPLLVTTVQMTPQSNGVLELRFEELLLGRKPQARAFQASLQPKLLRGFMHLLRTAVSHAEWEIATDQNSDAPGGGVSEYGTNQTQTKYLH